MTTDAEFVPSWVYSMADYCQMFDLSESDLEFAILDYPAGISSFNAEMFQQGYKVHSGDPNYNMSLVELTSFSKTILDKNVEHLKAHEEILRDSTALDRIVSDWEESRTTFLKDYEQGKFESRYQMMMLPRLPFDDQQFDIALCSDHLFHNHTAHKCQQEGVITELCRVAKEVRVFPLMNEQGDIAESLGQVMLECQQKGYAIEIKQVAFHQLKGGNAMLRIWATTCAVENA
ncbi:MAG: hypothetical protein KDH94_04690 [Coxiellaceae bacterium]|nr:hypothetical protein [Coxiellaceae bacterium]